MKNVLSIITISLVSLFLSSFPSYGAMSHSHEGRLISTDYNSICDVNPRLPSC